jgi:hypothetical protein
MNRAIVIVIACVAFIISAQSAAAEVTYKYTGSPFTQFSCGPDPSRPDTLRCPTPAPANPLTSYTTSDFVSVTVTLNAPLPPNAFVNLVTEPGFHMTLSDGHQTLTDADTANPMAMVTTDSSGQISTWTFKVLTDTPFRQIQTFNIGPLVSDEAFLACCDPAVSGDLGSTLSRGTWQSPVSCDIEMSKANYSNGQPVVAQHFRISNPAPGPISVEIKSWLDRTPGNPPVPILNVGADGSVVLPAGLNVDLGPFTLFVASAQVPFGGYGFNCRLVNPVTGQLLSEDFNAFVKNP